MIECAIMVGLAFVLSQIKLFRMPWGGSITAMSMLPIVVFGMRNGARWAFVCSGLYAAVQLIEGLANGLLSWGLTVPALIACILLDYLLAFTVLGIAGFFSGKTTGMAAAGAFCATFARFICSFLSGVVVWQSVGELWSGFSTDNAALYSLLYNGAYMMPEIVVTTAVAAAIAASPLVAKQNNTAAGLT